MAIEVAIPACGLSIIDEAIAAPPIVVLAVGLGDKTAGDMALAVAMTICAIIEEVDVVLVAIPFMPGMLALSIFAVFPSHSWIGAVNLNYQCCVSKRSFYS